MLAVPITSQQQGRSGLRPIDLTRDGRQVLRLLDESFGRLLNSQGQRILQGHLSYSTRGPLPLWMSILTRGFIPGFVWEENGRIVGNVSIVETERPDRFLVANVAVHPEHRRKGIARALMVKSIEYLTERRGREVLLQVESENQAARTLYQTLGFVRLGETIRWESSTARVRALQVGSDDLPQIRPLHRREWRAAFKLDTLSVRPALNWPSPPKADAYKTGLWPWLKDLVNGRGRECWVVGELSGVDSEDEMAGLAAIEREWGRPLQLRIRIAPDFRGRLERPLLAKLIRRLSYLRPGTAQINHPAEDMILNQLLAEANFQMKRRLTIERLELMT